MPKSKTTTSRKSKRSVKVKDLAPRKNPKGGKVSMQDFHFTHKVNKAST